MKKLMTSILLLAGLLASYPNFALAENACFLFIKDVDNATYSSYLTCDGKNTNKLNRIGRNPFEEISGQVNYILETYKLKMINCQLNQAIGNTVEYYCLFSK